MKEITREDWIKNTTPRKMWVWDADEKNKLKRLVVYILTKEEMAEVCTGYPVVTSDCHFRHCAEIEEPQLRRQTNYELAKWLADGASCGEFREYKYSNFASSIYSCYYYGESCENEPCPDNILIRVNGGEWEEPLKESEE